MPTPSLDLMPWGGRLIVGFVPGGGVPGWNPRALVRLLRLSSLSASKLHRLSDISHFLLLLHCWARRGAILGVSPFTLPIQNRRLCT